MSAAAKEIKSEHSHLMQNPLPALTCASFRSRGSIARTAFRLSVFLLQASQSGCVDSPVYEVPARKPEDPSSVPKSLVKAPRCDGTSSLPRRQTQADPLSSLTS